MTFLLTQVRAGFLFYRSVAWFTMGVSALILGAVLLPAIAEDRASGLLPALVLIKLLTGPVVWYLAERMRPHQYWFYYNLGLTRRRLWAGVAVLDTLLFVGAAAVVKEFCSQ